MKESRSHIQPENLQEHIDADASSVKAIGKFGQQYFTPQWVSEQAQMRLPSRYPKTILDPQVGRGDTISTGSWSTTKFGCDVDNRIEVPGIHLVTGNCVKVFEAMDDLHPGARWECINANPPFGLRWKMADGISVDSTEWTWKQATSRANYGYFIANHSTLVKLGINTHPLVFHYEVHDGASLWKGMRDTLKIGVACWKNPTPGTITESYSLVEMWNEVARVVDQEKVSRPPFNIFVDPVTGYIRTYLSYRSETKLKLKRDEIEKLHKLNDSHPLVLTTEKESRDLLRHLVSCGIYTVEPAARKAIDDALSQVNALACPIMPPTDFETVAYCDEEDALTCIAAVPEMRFTKGQTYPITTGTYKFVEKFKTRKVHLDEKADTQFTADHEWTRHGTDRFIQVMDDNGQVKRFMDRPVHKGMDFEESMLWKMFAKPVVKTIAETCPDVITQNLAILKSCGMVAGYKYYPGQLQYLARVAAKPNALVAGATGTGKSLAAISLLAMKGPERALIVAPQGTMRSSESDEEDDEDTTAGSGSSMSTASQWIQELDKFAPYLQIWELFSREDYDRICSLNGGKLPPGVYVTYYEAFFKNKAMEKVPDTWTDERLNKFIAKEYGLPPLETPEELGESKNHWCRKIGQEKNGIRSIIKPSLSTQIGDQFDFVALDEAHIACNLDALITQMIIRLQPKHRFAFTATPLPNIVSNLFSLMGWLAVPGWYKGDIRNAAWPYARGEISRFDNTFLSTERDHTQEAMNAKRDPRWRGSCVRHSPVISSPARLLKLLKPTMAYISKPDCNPDYREPKIVDVRVPMGLEQAKLYGHYLNRSNVPGGHPLVRARRQTAWLRNICADPAGFTHGGPPVSSNMNPKVITILEKVRDIVTEGEQVVIINSRKGLTTTIESKLIEAGISLARIDSTLPTEQHSHQANLFKAGKAQVLLMGIKCAASHSFDKCKYEIIGSLEYSNGPFDQAKGRIDRVNSRPGVTIYCILFKDSIEEVMFDTVAVKDDAATICLKGRRIPRSFVPVDGGDVLATAIDRFDITGSQPEADCEAQWPKLRDRIKNARRPLTVA